MQDTQQTPAVSLGEKLINQANKVNPQQFLNNPEHVALLYDFSEWVDSTGMDLLDLSAFLFLRQADIHILLIENFESKEG